MTVSVEHMSPNKLNFWLSKFSSFVKWPSKMEQNLLVCAINCHLRETEGEDSLNFLDKALKRQVNTPSSKALIFAVMSAIFAIA